MNYQELYQQKLTTAEEAVKVVKSGDWVDYSWCCNHPVALDKALAARKDELYDVKIRGGVTMWMPEVCKADDAGEHFTWNSWHCSGIDRKIIGKGMGFFGPMRYSELPRFYRDGNATVDVAMLQVTPMDAHGNFSFALSASHLADMLDRAKTIIVEVNQNMPWVNGLTGTEKMGTSTIYSAVMNPALPEEVVSSPFCWKKEASASAVPQQKPPVSRSFRERVEVAGFPRLRRTCRRIRHSISKNTKAMMDRAAMKASAGTYSAPTLCATKVVPQIRAASTAKDD